MTHPRSITVLVVDAVDSTALGALLGQERVEQLIADLLEMLGGLVVPHDGVVVRDLGDGLLARFPSAVSALDVAAEMHRAVARLNEEQRLRVPLKVRIALAASDALVLEGELRGLAPIHAARMEKLIPAGQTWCTDVVRLLAQGRGNHQFDPVGPTTFKGIDDPVSLHRVRVPLADMMGMPATLDSTKRFEFVGRQSELGQLEDAWTAAVAGAGRAVVISGQPGVGKTRLCREFALAVRERGAVVLHGRCPAESAQAFAPFTQALRAMLARSTDASAVLGDGAAELGRLVPELTALIPGLRAPSSEDATTDRFRLFEAIVSWLRAVSFTTPVLLVIDDLSWADEGTAHLFMHVADRLDADRVLILASYRTSDAHRAPRAVLQRSSIDRIDLGGLRDDEVVDFVETLLEGSLDDSARTATQTIGRHIGGNPLYLGEIVPSLVEQHVITLDPVEEMWRAGAAPAEFHVPAAVGDLITSRVQHLSVPCQHVLRTAAVIGFQFSPELLLELVEMQPLALVEALEEVADADLAQPNGATLDYEFTHAVIREAIYSALTPARRAAEHHRVAEAVESLFTSDLGPWLEVLAFQFEHGFGRPDREKAIDYLRQAGRAANGRLAYDHAVGLYRRAKVLEEQLSGGRPGSLTCDLLIELGTAERRSGSASARRTLMTAAHLALDLGDAGRATSAVLGAGRGTFSIAGEVETERVEALRRALELTGPAPTAQRARLLATLSSELTFDDDPDAAERASDEALAIARRVGDVGLLVTVLGMRLIALWRVDRVEERLAHAAELEAICNLAGQSARGKFLSAMTVCCQVAMEAGDFVTADRLLAWLDETSQTLHQPTSLAYAKLRLASRACIAGRLDEAERLADEAYELCAQAGQPDAEAFHTGQLFTIRLHQGRADEVIDRMAHAAKSFPGIVAFAAGEATCAADIGDAVRCRAVIDPVLAGLDDLRMDINWLTTIALATGAVHYLGDRAAAARLRPLLTPYRRLYVDNASAFFGSAHHYYALLSVVLDDEPAVADGFTAALDAHTTLRSPTWLARTMVEYATALASERFGSTERATELASSALALATRWGLGLVEQRAVALLD